jgi:hypothetical protein
MKIFLGLPVLVMQVLTIPYQNIIFVVGYEVVTVVIVKNSIFWNITPCSQLNVSRCFGGTCRLHLEE